MFKLNYKHIEDKCKILKINTKIKKIIYHLQNNFKIVKNKIIFIKFMVKHKIKFMKWLKKIKKMTKNNYKCKNYGNKKWNKIQKLLNTVKNMNNILFKKMLKIYYLEL